MSKFVQFVDGEIEFGLQIFDPGPQSVARMPQNFCFSGLLLANHATQWGRRMPFATLILKNWNAGIDQIGFRN